MNNETILSVNNIVTSFNTESGEVRAVDDVSFELKQGEILGIVGESGCGKSVTALSIMRLLPKPAGNIESGEINFKGTDIVQLPADKMHEIRGNRISMIFQEPMTALNPVHRIGRQLEEVYFLHYPRMNKKEINEKASELLHHVGIPDPRKRLKEYPHQISGGMRQRVMIAMALACRPEVLIADEPTTALDVTIQSQILELIKELQKETGMSVIFITHDLGVIAEICDSVVVMYAGRIAEIATVEKLFHKAKHPYTKGLLSSIPRLEDTPKTKLNIIEGMVPSLYELPPGCRFQNRCPYVEELCKSDPPQMKIIGKNHSVSCHFWDHLILKNRPPAVNGKREKTPSDVEQPKTETCLSVANLKMHFPVYGGVFRRRVGNVYAVDGISFEICTGETIGLVGESGCGKTTVGRCILKLYKPTEGSVRFGGTDILGLKSKELRTIRRHMQMIFQDPFESLNSRHTIGEILEEPFVIHRVGTQAERKKEIKYLLERVGLQESVMTRFPHEFSGGQRQRIGIARAIALRPKLVICDEPVSALDVSIQSQILNLLLDLQREMGLTYFFIAHDLAVVRHISDRIAVMYLGKIVEFTDADTIYTNPLHPYTQALISSIPVPDPEKKSKKQPLSGDVPSPIHPPSGCRFHTRCPKVMDRCRIEEPELIPAAGTTGESHLAACYLCA